MSVFKQSPAVRISSIFLKAMRQYMVFSHCSPELPVLLIWKNHKRTGIMMSCRGKGDKLIWFIRSYWTRLSV